jgi:DNA-binding NtrC family response regulator
MIWQSIFTHDMRRYYRSLYERMGEVPTLVTGPSGTGKELVARAIGYSRYIPFSSKRQAFLEDFTKGFFPINLAALSSQLIESELFGHKKGSFTGALEDHKGYFEDCGNLGTIFLDEIGEASEDIQVKLLRVLQTRQFQRLGDTKIRQFQGKIVAATNRNLADEMQTGRFREDFYYSLCADKIETPSLDAQIKGDKDTLFQLTLFLTNKIAGPAEASTLSQETEQWIRNELPKGYSWPGNIRELEQCIRNIMIHQEYRPAQADIVSKRISLGSLVDSTQLTADELLEHYCTLVYHNLKSYEATARHLKLDRRTVKSKIDSRFLAKLEQG